MRLIYFMAGVLLMTASPALAQDTSRGEVTAGWRLNHVTFGHLPDPVEIDLPNDYPEGWYADIAVNASPKFAIVGEASGSYHTDQLSRTSGSLTINESLDIKIHTFMGGIRVRAPQLRGLVPFGQVLFGGEHDSGTAERRIQVGQSNPSVSVREGSTSSPVLALDAGVTMMGGPIAVRASAGYMRYFRTADSDGLRVSVGAGFRF